MSEEAARGVDAAVRRVLDESDEARPWSQEARLVTDLLHMVALVEEFGARPVCLW